MNWNFWKKTVDKQVFLLSLKNVSLLSKRHLKLLEFSMDSIFTASLPKGHNVLDPVGWAMSKKFSISYLCWSPLLLTQLSGSNHLRWNTIVNEKELQMSNEIIPLPAAFKCSIVPATNGFARKVHAIGFQSVCGGNLALWSFGKKTLSLN